jgi:hypothetical protein
LVRDAQSCAHMEARQMIIIGLLLCVLCIGVFAAVWELERIRQILDKRP